MMLDYFPLEIGFSANSEDDSFIPLLKTEFESNHQAVRRKTTKNRKKFNAVIEWVSTEQITMLYEFWKSHLGKKIYLVWTDGETYEVTITTEHFIKKYAAPGFYNTNIEMEES